MNFIFPDPQTADETGLVAVTDILTPSLVLQAYRQGIFPWSEHPVRWYSPDPRAVFLREHVQIPKRLGKVIRKEGFTVTLDRAFKEVMQACSRVHRHDGVWITPGFVRTYYELHESGYAHSVEVWQGDTLAGGLYGVQLGGLFAGESMFYRVPNASKVAFAALVTHLDAQGTTLIDAQVLNAHTERLGAVAMPRSHYLKALDKALCVRTLYDGQKWPRSFDESSWP